MKTCSKCGETKPLNCFHAQKAGQHGVKAVCKDCVSIYRKHRYDCNRQQEQAYQKQYYTTHKELCISKSKEYNKEHREKYNNNYKKYRNKNQEKVKQRNYLWKKANKDVVNFYNATRKATKKKATPAWLSTEHLSQIKTEYSLAHWCSTVMGIKYHVDHIVPLQGKNVCGLHVPWNLRVIPATDNISKGNRHDT